jgi:hypothetical protein
MEQQKPTNHFRVMCLKYPEFSFNVNELRKYRIKRDYDGRDERREAKGVVFFQQHVLDTEALGFDEEEARIVHEAIKKRTSVPIYGRDIVEQGQPILSEIPDGKFSCGDCTKRFASMEGLTQHYEVHKPKKEK